MKRWKAIVLMLMLVAGTAVPALLRPHRGRSPAPMPYMAIHQPEFVAASEATFLQDEDILLGVASGKAARRSRQPTSRSMARWPTSCRTGRSQ